MKIAYRYHPQTREYLGETIAQLDTLESEKQGKDVYIIPADSTYEPPPSFREGVRLCFIDNKWKEIEPPDEELAEKIRFMRNQLMMKVGWRIERYRQQKELGIKTTESEEKYLALLRYIQSLRDVPQQEGFPRNVVFPTLGNEQ